MKLFNRFCICKWSGGEAQFEIKLVIRFEGSVWKRILDLKQKTISNTKS